MTTTTASTTTTRRTRTSTKTKVDHDNDDDDDGGPIGAKISLPHASVIGLGAMSPRTHAYAHALRVVERQRARDMPEWRGTTDDGRRTTRRRRRREDGGGAKGKDLTETVLSHVDATCADHAVKALMEVNNIPRAVPDFISAISAVLAQIDQKGPKKEKSQKSNTSRTPPPILGDFRKFC